MVLKIVAVSLTQNSPLKPDLSLLHLRLSAGNWR